MSEHKKSYKQLEQELQAILDRVEVGDYDNLDDMLADHEAAQKLIASMKSQLKSAKNSIKTIKK